MLDLRPYNRNRKNNEVYYNPFRAMDELERQFFGEPFAPLFGETGLEQFRTDISDLGDSFLLEADLPGFDKKDIKLSLNGDMLTVSAERHSSHEEKDKRGNYLRCERSYGTYTRSYDMTGVDTERITAKYENGVLRLTLPKQPELTPASRMLEIE